MAPRISFYSSLTESNFCQGRFLLLLWREVSCTAPTQLIFVNENPKGLSICSHRPAHGSKDETYRNRLCTLNNRRSSRRFTPIPPLQRGGYPRITSEKHLEIERHTAINTLILFCATVSGFNDKISGAQAKLLKFTN